MMKSISIENAEHYRWGDHCDGWHLLKSPGLSVIQEKVPAGETEIRHFHSHAHQFFYILSGTATLEINGDIVRLTAGNGLHIPAQLPHQFRNESNSAVEFLVISSPPSHGDRQNCPGD